MAEDDLKKKLKELGFDPEYVGYGDSLDKPLARLTSAQEGIKGKERVDTESLRKTGRAWSTTLTPEQRESMAAYREYDAAREDIASRAAESLNTPKGATMSRQEAARTAVDEIARAGREGQFGPFTAKSTLPVAAPPVFFSDLNTIESGSAAAPKLGELAPSSVAPSPEGNRLGQLGERKLLADELRQFAAGQSKETAESLAQMGSDIGVSRGQLSSLYKQYKSEMGNAPQSTFEREEEQARARSKASGAFGGEGQRGQSSAGFAVTPNLDRWQQMQNEPVGSRRMGDERRIITSPAGQMRSMARKAARAGIDINSLISANRGNVEAAYDTLQAAGLGPRGIRTQEEARARSEQMAQERETKRQLLLQQAEQMRKAEEAKRIAAEEAAKKERNQQA